MNSDNNTSSIYPDELLAHDNALYNFAFRLSRDEDDARDLVQDTYLRAFRYADNYTRGTNARSWLYRIMYHLFINRYRRKNRSPIVSSHEPEEDRLIQISVPSEAFQNTFSDDVMLAFNHLKPEFKTAIFLRDFEDLKYEEISRVLDLPLCTVKTRIHRARQSMKKLLLKRRRSASE